MALLSIIGVAVSGRNESCGMLLTVFATLDEWHVFMLLLLTAAVIVLAISARHVRNVNRVLRREIAMRTENQRVRDQLETRMSDVERMKSLGHLAGGIAHDLNNLLTSVICDAETLLMDADSDATTPLRSIVRSAESAAELSRIMLTYSGKRVVVKAVCELNQLVQSMMPLARAAVDSSVRVTFEGSGTPTHADVDSTALDQALLNLITNSSEAVSSDGRIVIRVGEESIDQVAVDAELYGDRTQGGEFVFVEVVDNGSGIDADVRAKVFEPFFTTGMQGRGLGLSVVYGHVNRHHGLIRLRSGPNGTQIRILLPKVSGPVIGTNMCDEATLNDYRADLKGVRVLVVDDEPDVLSSIQRLLLAQGCDVDMAGDGREAIEMLGERSPDFDLVITDLVMPRCDGHTLVSWMRQQTSDLPVVVMSGFSDRDISKYNEMDNVVSTLEKPFTPDRMCEAVERGVRAQ